MSYFSYFCIPVSYLAVVPKSQEQDKMQDIQYSTIKFISLKSKITLQNKQIQFIANLFNSVYSNTVKSNNQIKIEYIAQFHLIILKYSQYLQTVNANL